MRKYTILLIALFLLLAIGCKSLPDKEVVTLPPRPARPAFVYMDSLESLAQNLILYDAYCAEWESWGNKVEKIVYGETDDMD